MSNESPYSKFSIEPASLGQPLQLTLDVLDTSKTSTISASKVFLKDISAANSVNAEIKSVQYYRTFFDRPDVPPPCDKYTMFQVFFDTDFSSGEFNFLRARFQDFSRIFLTNEFLRAIAPLGMNNVNSPRDKSLPLISGNPVPDAFNEDTTFYVIYAGIMANYFLECQDRLSWPRPRFIPIFARRYEKPQDGDGFWEAAWAPVNRLNETRTCEINFNATAMSDAGFSDASWASTIMHEMMHNGGWRHPNGYNDRTQYMLAVEDVFEGLV